MVGGERVRAADGGDVDAVVALARAAYRSPVGWCSEADLVAGDRTDASAVARLISGPDSLMLVVEGDRGRGLVACCALEDLGRGVARLGMFAVDPERQGGGIGRRLLDEAARVAARGLRAETIELVVLAPQTALLAWYERLGFRRTGEARRFPADPVHARPQRDGLSFVVLMRELGRHR
ncbi:MAG: GNAT family N-acetyltransferase [Solirubrobacterales bacterium]|nr:GNAT family N-acetyltransferase [Solirubrobacterales bacterium]